MFKRVWELLQDDGVDGDLAIVGLFLIIVCAALTAGIFYFLAKALF